jgi:predicted SPOUT superfamily RNA methylase MTH1
MLINQINNNSNYFLITIGSPLAGMMELEPLTRVENDVDRIIQLFTNQGYDHVLEEIAIGANANSINTALANWFSSNHRKASDIVVNGSIVWRTLFIYN